MRFTRFIRSIVWPAVLAVAFGIAALAVAFLSSGDLAQVIALSSAAVTSALLATRA
jgi:hypothetical protein